MQKSVLFTLSQTKFFHHRFIGFFIGARKIVNKTLAFCHHFEQSATWVKILFVFLQMCRQFVDACGKKRNLILRWARIGIMPLHILGCVLLLACCECHTRFASAIASFHRTTLCEKDNHYPLIVHQNAFFGKILTKTPSCPIINGRFEKLGVVPMAVKQTVFVFHLYSPTRTKPPNHLIVLM